MSRATRACSHTVRCKRLPWPRWPARSAALGMRYSSTGWSPPCSTTRECSPALPGDGSRPPLQSGTGTDARPPPGPFRPASKTDAARTSSMRPPRPSTPATKTGLEPAVVADAFERYLARKGAEVAETDDVGADHLRGWDMHVAFGAANPALYKLMWSRPLTRCPSLRP